VTPSPDESAPRGRAQPAAAESLSLVVPLYNEAENVAPLAESVHQALAAAPWPWELILVDDGSSDATPAQLHAARERFGPHVRTLQLQRNFGQTAAMQAGIDAATGSLVVTLDGDLQNDPADVPRMVQRLVAEDLDLLVGWRRDRQDNVWSRTIPSRIANRLIGRVTGVRLHDYGCSLKVYRASVLKGVRLFGEMHRFIPAWLALQTSPTRIREEVVHHRPRLRGASKYGIGRTYRVLLDLFSVYFFLRFLARPGHFFGRFGLAFGLTGGLILAYLGFVKLALGEDIGTRPLLAFGVLLVVVAVQFLTTGVLSELLARTYFAAAAGQSYVVRRDSGGSGPSARAPVLAQGPPV
jgi:glycosyltransferase involved in cell wall biosynthesis